VQKDYQLKAGALIEGPLTYLPVDVVWSSGRRVRLDLDSSLFERIGKKPQDFDGSVEDVLLKNWIEVVFSDNESAEAYFYVIRQQASDKILTHRPSLEERAGILDRDLRLSKLTDDQWEQYLDEQDIP